MARDAAAVMAGAQLGEGGRSNECAGAQYVAIA